MSRGALYIVFSTGLAIAGSAQSLPPLARQYSEHSPFQEMCLMSEWWRSPSTLLLGLQETFAIKEAHGHFVALMNMA